MSLGGLQSRIFVQIRQFWREGKLLQLGPDLERHIFAEIGDAFT